MKLLTKTIKNKLVKNAQSNLTEQGISKEDTIDHKPVVKFFNPMGAATWLITELDPTNMDIMFGLCDMGFGCPELGSVSLSEMEAIRLPLGLKIERDRFFVADKTLSEYAEEARSTGRIQA